MSSNISKEKRENLLSKMNEIRKHIASSHQDKNTANLLTYIAEIEESLKSKKYGLVFEEHKEEIDDVLESHVPVLEEDKDLFINNGGEMNFLIEGDNLAALKLLEKTHKGKIDLIYIDPPYNTGNKDFIYNDEFIDNQDTFRHSKWLSFINQRLKIAKNLLSESGSIFISIDDNEYANLKLLSDDIFGHQNFIGTLIRKTVSQRAMAKLFNTQHEYCLIYSSNKNFLNLSGDLKNTDMYKNPDNDINGPWKSSDPTMKGSSHIYSIKNPFTGRIDNPPPGRGWAFSKDKMTEHLENGRIYFKDSYRENERGFIYKSYMQNLRSEYLLVNSLDVNSNDYLNQHSTKDILNIFGKINFDYAKPLSFIKKIISYNKTKNMIVLDFFAGSGTTGHAVLSLNKEDGGNRKFILATNNENNIAKDVTYERIKRVIEKDNYQASFKYYSVNYLPIKDKLYYEYADDLLRHVREFVELENAINFEGNNEFLIALTESELDDITQNIPTECTSIYLGHDVLPTQAQEELFKLKNIKINIIPNYYYGELEG